MPNNYIASVTLYSNQQYPVEWPYACGRQMLLANSKSGAGIANRHSAFDNTAATAVQPMSA